MPEAYFDRAKDKRQEEYDSTFGAVEEYCETGTFNNFSPFVVPSGSAGTSTTAICIRLRYAERHPHILIRIRKHNEALAWIREFQNMVRVMKNEPKEDKEKKYKIKNILADFPPLETVENFDDLVQRVKPHLPDSDSAVK